MAELVLRGRLPVANGYRPPRNIPLAHAPANEDDTWWSIHGGAVRVLMTPAPLGASASLMARLPRLELIAVFGAGTDAIDLAAAATRGIAIETTPDILTDSVADMALALILAARRDIVASDAFVRAGRWRDCPAPLTRDLRGARLGILGMGRIGRAVAARAAPFGMVIGYRGGHGEGTPFATPTALAQWADILVVACPANAATRGLVDAAVIAALGSEGLLVNIARGSIVHEEALIEALTTRRLGAAALDVFAGEPGIDPRFAALPNVLLSPHVASATVETRAAMADAMFGHVLRWQDAGKSH